jgi:type I restriction enzyme S subunit
VLFGKRRAYQRKVAVADFDAICSGDIYVFETAGKTQLLQELLPYICQTDSFFDYAVDTSAGSLSPRTNWKSLAEYEFALPPLNDQQQIIRALRSMWEVTECAVNAINKLETLLDSLMMRLFDPRAALRPLKDFCDKPIAYGIVQAGPDVQEGVPYIRVSEMTAQGELSALAMR